MPKYFEYVFLLLTFVVGITIGLYSGTDFTKNINEIAENRIVRTVQDAVIAKIQEEYNLKKIDTEDSLEDFNAEINYIEDYIKKDKDIVTVSASITKLSPSAEMVIKKNFSRCSHSEVNRMKIPVELVNYTEEEVMKKYSGWTIEKFSTDEIILSKDIDANCTDHYVIKETNGKVAVYNEIAENKMNFIENIDVDLTLLSDEEKGRFADGIRVYGKEEVSSLVEDYNS